MKIRGLTNAMSMSRHDSQQSMKSDNSQKRASRLLDGAKSVKKASSKKMLLSSQNEMRKAKPPHLQLNGQ